MSTCYTDLRKSYEGLRGVVYENFDADPLSGAMFVFFNRSCDRLKILYWQVNGFCLWQKRLEKGKFILPRFDKSVRKLEVSSYQFQGLVQGLACWHVKEAQALTYLYS